MIQATLKFTGAAKNPVKRKVSPAQLAARQKFADMVRARAAAAKGKKMPRKNPSISHAINNLRTVKQMRDWFGIQTDGLTDGQVKALKSELIILGYGEYTAGQLPPKVFYNALNFATGRKTNPRKKTVSQKISQLEHEGYPHKQSIAIALSEQRRGKVTRNPRLRTVSIAKKNPTGLNAMSTQYLVTCPSTKRNMGFFNKLSDAKIYAQELSDKHGMTHGIKTVKVPKIFAVNYVISESTKSFKV